MSRAAGVPWVVQFVLASIVAAVAGFFGLVFLFSDPTGGAAERAMWLGVHFFIPGLVIGLLFPRVWYMALLVAWAPVISTVGGVVIPFVMPEYPRTSLTVREGALDVDPAVVTSPTFHLEMSNRGAELHKIVVVPTEEGNNLEDVVRTFDEDQWSRDGRSFYGMSPLNSGESSTALVDIGRSRRAVLLCSIPRHAARGEKGELLREGP